ncbi:zinc finger and BTB domain-containing protein 49-like [Anopheles maculipalpis]|uniref:zinc finger and BTB domain-containing protein 49-like n=1 Tax=Anopheles maculipalpis TaxID=1496333 RepID=UPI00215995E3|nr:zinc finger and BTB domain-containing protein 49-like [Anopheles maculipalpis]
MDSSEICRVCVEEVNSFWCLFEACAMLPADSTPAIIISACTGIEINRNDGLPEAVCDSCLHALVAALEIREKCISSDRKLRKILLHKKASSAKRTTNEEIKIQQNLCEIQIMQQSVENDESVEVYESIDVDGFGEDEPGEPDYGDALVELQDRSLQPEYCDDQYLIKESQEQAGIDYPEDDDFQIIVEDSTTDAEVNLKIEPSDETSTVVSGRDSQGGNEPITGGSSKCFVCHICDKRFSSKGNLKAHGLLHSNYKPYRCEVCGDEFSRQHNYKVHKIRHAGKRIHQCPVCEKSFVCSVNLKNHMVQHSDVKPYRCDQCGKEFGYRTDLARHEIRHTGVYPFACDICQHKFSRKTSLNKHLLRCKGLKKERRKKRSLK